MSSPHWRNKNSNEGIEFERPIYPNDLKRLEEVPMALPEENGAMMVSGRSAIDTKNREWGDGKFVCEGENVLHNELSENITCCGKCEEGFDCEIVVEDEKYSFLCRACLGEESRE